ncbi:hypothetical protein CYLTODRAFT_494642 [Cylindrobasidium torrendii FP15055 ss-10]|uniref:Uncharacterized protein n=1 Tax=Cylindrobasidium torrendii FP15055 ss-10 TaxID=1314674 RepID=A0A0D7AWS0_9AGAR|nr:hypothetical protein CYLTODRAFT_494642 [Cylindrobasidium torrendii FP15055 ss-10]
MNVDFDTQWKFCRRALECACPNHKIPQLLDRQALWNSSDDCVYRALSLNNDEPSAADITALRSAIDAIQARAADVSNTERELRELRLLLSAQIEHIDATLETLQAEHVKMADAITAYKLPLSPVRRLPNELLQNIFGHLVSFPYEASFDETSIDPLEWCTSDDSESPLWALELVCKRWREALLGDAKIWSVVHVEVSADNFDPYSSSHTTSQLLTHLERSKQSDLSVTISLEPGFDEDHLPAPCMAFLYPYATRIRRLQLLLPFRLLQDFAFMAPRLRGVQHLYLINACTRRADALQRTAPGQVTTFAQCTELHSLDVVDGMNNLMALDLHWASLRTVLTTHSFTPLDSPLPSPSPRPGQYLHVLKMAKGLKHAFLDVEAFHLLPNPVATPTIICTRLTTLELVVRPEFMGSIIAVEQLFADIFLPSLESLLVEGRSEDGGVVGAGLRTTALEAISRSLSSALRSCCITGLRLNSLEVLYDLLHQRPRLESLILGDIDREQSFEEPHSLTPLTPLLELTESGEVLLPKLHTFELEGRFKTPGRRVEQKFRRAVNRLKTHGVLQHFVLTNRR